MENYLIYTYWIGFFFTFISLLISFKHVIKDIFIDAIITALTLSLIWPVVIVVFLKINKK